MDRATGLSRREFLRASTGGGLALGSLLHLGTDLRAAKAELQDLKIAHVRQVPSVCPYWAVGCGQIVSVRRGQIINIEGNPESPISRGTGFLSAAGEEDKRRAATCDQCHGYVKMIATLSALSPVELLVADVATLHLDLAAAERGYAGSQASMRHGRRASRSLNFMHAARPVPAWAPG